jgi:hypothetical protein
MVLVLIPVGVFLYALYAYATNGLSHQWGEAITKWIVDVSPFGSTFGKPIARWIVHLADWISNRMAEAYTPLARHAVNWFGGMADFVKHFIETALSAPLDLIVFARWLLERELPRLIHALPTSVSQLVHDMAKALHSITAEIPRLERYAKGVARAAAFGIIAPFVAALPALGWLKHHLGSIARAAAHAGSIALPWADLPDIKKWLHANRARITRLEGLLGIAGAAALVARALGGVSAKCIRNGNISKVAKRLCGLDANVLESLLLDGLVIVSAISVVEFAEALLEIESEAIKIMGAGIKEFPG